MKNVGRVNHRTVMSIAYKIKCNFVLIYNNLNENSLFSRDGLPLKLTHALQRNTL